MSPLCTNCLFKLHSFLLVDDLGWNDVSFHQGSDFETPILDSLASNALHLTNYYTQHYCTPSRSALMSGRYPIHDGLQLEVIHEDADYGLDLSITTLPQYLQTVGYKTHMLGYILLFSHNVSPQCFPTVFSFCFRTLFYFVHNILNVIWYMICIQ